MSNIRVHSKPRCLSLAVPALIKPQKLKSPPLTIKLNLAKSSRISEDSLSSQTKNTSNSIELSRVKFPDILPKPSQGKYYKNFSPSSRLNPKHFQPVLRKKKVFELANSTLETLEGDVESIFKGIAYSISVTTKKKQSGN